MSSSRKLDKAREVAEAVRLEQYRDLGHLQGCKNNFSENQLKPGDVAYGTWYLVRAVGLFVLTLPKQPDFIDMRFSHLLDNNMRGCQLRTSLAHTTLSLNGKKMKRKYDLANSSAERYQLLIDLIRIWSKREDERNRRLERSGASEPSSKVSKDLSGSIAAQQRFYRNKTRRLKRRVAKPYKPSPLGEKNVQTASEDEATNVNRREEIHGALDKG